MRSKLTAKLLLSVIGVTTLLCGGIFYITQKQKADAMSAAETAQALKERDEESARIAELEAKLNALSSSTAEKVVTATSTPSLAQRNEIAELQNQLNQLKSAQKKAIPLPAVLPPPPAVISTTPAPVVSTTLTTEDIAAKAKPSVVAIEARGGKGTGFVIDASGLILTNAHVVGNALGVTLTFADKKSVMGYVVAIDKDNDIAIVHVYDGGKYTPLVLGVSAADTLKQGASLYAFGYPFGLTGDVSFKDGTLSRELTYKEKGYIEMSNSIHPGNSGGPVLNNKGEVVGMSTMIYGYESAGVSMGETIKLAIPSDRLKSLYETLKSKQYTLTADQRSQIAQFEKFSGDFITTLLVIQDASIKYGAAFTDHVPSEIDDSMVLYEKASGQATTLMTNYPKQFPFSSSIPLQLNQLKRIATDMIETKDIARNLVASGVTDQASYSKYDELTKRIASTVQINNDLFTQSDNIEEQARTYFLSMH